MHREDDPEENMGKSLVPPLTPQDKGVFRSGLDAMRAGGIEAQLIADEAQKAEAAENDAQESPDVTDTPFLRELEQIQGAKARHAKRWRPQIIAALKLCPHITVAARFCRVDWKTVTSHRQKDAIFDEACRNAEEEGAGVLFASAWSAAVEGTVEPVWFQGLHVGYTRKYSDRMRELLLKAKMPDLFDRAQKLVVKNGNGSGSDGAGMDAAAAAKIVNKLSPVMGARHLAMLQGKAPAPLKTVDGGSFVRIEDLPSANPKQEDAK